MAYDEALAGRVRKLLARRRGLVERKMFGGLAFMLRGNMCCGVLGDELILRLGIEGAEEALERPFTRKFDFTGRPMRGFAVVHPDGCAADDDLAEWVKLATDFARTLPAK